MRSRCGVILILMCLCTCALATVEERPRFVEVPRSHWAYKAYKQLVNAGIAVYPTVCYRSSRGAHFDAQHLRLTRYEFAVVTQRALAVLKYRSRQAKGKQTVQENALKDATNKLAVEFRWEIAQISRK